MIRHTWLVDGDSEGCAGVDAEHVDGLAPILAGVAGPATCYYQSAATSTHALEPLVLLPS